MSEWKDTRLKSLLKAPLVYGLNVSSEEERTDWPRYIRITDFDDYNNLSNETFLSLPFDIAKDAWLKDGDMLFARSGATAGKTFLYTELPFGACYAGYLIRARLNRKEVLPKYVSYYTKSWEYEIWKERVNIQTTIRNISADKYNQLPLAIPTLEVQSRIVSYLDAKTSAIDSRISLLEQKCEAYERLKKSIINDVITRGLNSNVKMKDSGVEWIGEIPEHWEIKRFKEFASTQKGKQTDYLDEQIDGSDIVLTVETLRQDVPSFYNYAIVSDKVQHCTTDDIVVIWDGAGVGEFLRAKDGVLSSTIAKIIVDEKQVLKEYLWLWRYKIEYVLKSIPTGIGIPHLNPTLLNNYLLPIPPIKEQIDIINKVTGRVENIDSAISILNAQIEKYKLLKRSLINEVITGQRKVD